jgi:PAS domain S-box-containing protein
MKARNDLVSTTPPATASEAMEARVRSHDWSRTPLGPIPQWPPQLQTLVDMCLLNRFPMTVWWGPELTLIYNDAYAPILGKRHPDALGKRANDVWTDVWPVIGPQVESVLAGGNATWSDQVQMVLERNGFVETGWFTWSFSALRDEHKNIRGVLLTVVEDTKRVLAEQERDRLNQLSRDRQAEELARTILESVSDAFFSLNSNWEFTYANPEAGRILGRPTPELIGKSIWSEYPGLYGTDFEPIYRNAMDHRVGGMITQFYPDHHRWYEVRTYPSPNGISVFFRDVTAAKNMADNFGRQTRLFERIASATSDFLYIFGRDGRVLYANKKLLELWNVIAEEAVGKTLLELGYPQWHAEMHLREIQQVIDTKQPIRGEVSFTGKGGISGVFDYIFNPVLGPDGEVEVIAGTTRNVTERRQLETERERLVSILESERSNLAAVVEKAPAFIATLKGPEHVFELANEEYYKLAGRRNIIGKTVREAFPEVIEQGFIGLLDQVFRTGEPFIGKEISLALDSAGVTETHFINFVYQATRGPDGEPSGIFVHGVDVTDLIQSRRAIEASEKQRRLALDAAELGSWHFDPAIQELITDKRMREIYGLTTDRMTYDDVVRLVHPDDRQQVVDAIAAATRLVDPVPYAVEHRVVRTNGTVRWVFGKGRANFETVDGGAVRISFDGTTADITDRKAAENERQSLLEAERVARLEAERAGKMKDEFLATLSHEIRTPLNAILGWSQIMRASKDPEDIAAGLDVIERNARAQSQIVDDLLDMSRIISGKVRLDVQRIDLAAIVQSAIETARPTAEAKGVRLKSVIDPLHRVAVSGDANRLQQVLWNLISNAVKFTPRGGQIQVLLERVDSHIEISVIDTGQGIPPDFLPFVFDRFRQQDASTTRRHGGLGLGLSIVKQLVELHGGTVSATSGGEGKGSTFCVHLPLTILQQEPQAEVARRHPATDATFSGISHATRDLAGVRILVVDDEVDAREMVKRLLERSHAEVTAVSNVADAVALIGTGKFDVLISDVGMPGEDGYSLIRKVRALDRDNGGKIPAIALTAYARAEDRVKAVAAGFLMHVSKPVEPVELLTMVAAAAGIK